MEENMAIQQGAALVLCDLCPFQKLPATLMEGIVDIEYELLEVDSKIV